MKKNPLYEMLSVPGDFLRERPHPLKREKPAGIVVFKFFGFVIVNHVGKPPSFVSRKVMLYILTNRKRLVK